MCRIIKSDIMKGASHTGMWKRKMETEAVEAVTFLWKRNHFDERGRKRKQTRKR